MRLISLVKYRLLILVCLLFIFSNSNSQHSLVINEIMSSNSSTISDEDGDYPDWIEIYNPTDNPISLDSYGLSDDLWNPYKWLFPDTLIPAGGFMIVFASGKNRNQTGNELHLNFAINTVEDAIVFINDDGLVIDQLIVQAMPTDISLGRYPDGNNNWVFYNQSSPGFTNGDLYFNELLQDLQFSHPAGYYNESFFLNINSNSDDEIIIYTVDGSEPDIMNLEGTTYYYKNSYPENPGDPYGELIPGSFASHLYVNPLYVYDKSLSPDSITGISTTFALEPYYTLDSPVRKSFVVRARNYKPGALPGNIVTASYFIAQENQSQNPILSLSISENLLFDYLNGIYVAGKDFDDWRASYPNQIAYGNRPANYWRIGEEAEYPCHLEIFEPQQSLRSFAQDIGVRIHGGWTRAYPCKSLRLYARNKYGKSEINYPVFTNYDFDTFKRLILRNSGNDWGYTLFRDGLMQSLVKHLNLKTQEFRTAILYINGEYWGIHNIRERFDKHYLSRVFGVNPENIDYLNNNSVIVYGDAVAYNELKTYILLNSIEVDEHYNHIKTKVDIDNFIDYQISNIFFGNKDWPRNNVDFWRLKTEYDSISEYGHDGRWRWLLYDTDFGFGLYGESSSHNTLEYASQWEGYSWENPLWSTYLLRNFFLNESFRIQFINRFADLLNTAFLPSRINESIDQFTAIIENEIEQQTHRWGRPADLDSWIIFVDIMKNYVNQRPFHQRNHIKEKFNIEDVFSISLDVSDSEHGIIRINSVHISSETVGINEIPYPWTGIYFDEIPIEVEAIPKPGYRFSHWEGCEIMVNALEEDLLFSENVSLKAYFEPEINRTVLYYWHFNNLSDSEQVEVPVDYSFFDFATVLEFKGDGPGLMDRADDGTLLNAMENHDAGYALRVRNPSHSRELLLELPTTGFENIVFSYACRKSENGATVNAVYFSDGIPENWVRAYENIYILQDYKLVYIDFSRIDEINNNPVLKIKIVFGGNSALLNEGNNRFDNIMISGVPLPETNFPPTVYSQPEVIELVENDITVSLNLYDYFEDINNDPLQFGFYDINEFISVELNDSILNISPIRRGGAIIRVFASDPHQQTAYMDVNVLVYPEPHKLLDKDYYFTSWNKDESEGHYPENILFLQSTLEHPILTHKLQNNYIIPHDQYSQFDFQNIGFPYRTIYGTRINGLEDNGISFINTGTNRDLGAVLLAVDFSEVDQAYITWTNQTLEFNQREYAFRLLFRKSLSESFEPFIIDGEPIDFLGTYDGYLKQFLDIKIPDFLLEENNVQFMWRFFPISNSIGNSSRIRFDDLMLTKNLSNIKDEVVTESFIFPNPSSGVLNITLSGFTKGCIYNFLGVKLLEFDQTRINIEHLSPGTYFIVLNSSGKQSVFRGTFIKI